MKDRDYTHKILEGNKPNQKHRRQTQLRQAIKRPEVHVYDNHGDLLIRGQLIRHNIDDTHRNEGYYVENNGKLKQITVYSVERVCLGDTKRATIFLY